MRFNPARIKKRLTSPYGFSVYKGRVCENGIAGAPGPLQGDKKTGGNNSVNVPTYALRQSSGGQSIVHCSLFIVH